MKVLSSPINSGTLLVTVLFVVLLTCCSDKNNPVQPIRLPIVGPDSVLLADGTSKFLAGINWPWRAYGHDFGQVFWSTGTWPHDGISTVSALAFADSQLAQCRSLGVSFLRCFVFADGRAAPEFDSLGNVLGFDSLFFRDMDAFLVLCNQHKIRLIVVLLDYSWLNDAKQGDGGVVLGGHADLVTDSVKCESFLRHCIRPMMGKYGQSQTIAAWELMNEPEWRLKGMGNAIETVERRSLVSFFKKMILEIRKTTNQPITLGCAKGDFLSFWTELDLDFYQIHCYGNDGNLPPFQLKSDIESSIPVVVGEFPTKGSSFSLDAYMNASWNYGYAGGFAWSMNGSDNSTLWTQLIADDLKLWLDQH